jgi:aspartyl-tRNA(Asn)/glutamyl-tRNA(Gln) amidotransferase subunit A
MADDSLRYLSIREMGARFRSGDLSPVEVTRAHLDAIDELNDQTHDFITVTADRAKADALAAEQAFRSGEDLGPLLGVPVALKDLVDTAGIPTTAGTTIWKDRTPTQDATIARRLAGAGSVLLGKTNLVEFAFGPYGVNPHYGTPPNPWIPDRVPGGSSCGSGGAVARGCAVAAIGTDTGGSIRLPASFCGVVGLKPTVQCVSRAGVVPLSWTLDSVGPLARTVMDAAIIFDAIAGGDPHDDVTLSGPSFSSVADSLEVDRTFRVGIARDPFFDGADDEVVQLVDAAIGVLAENGVHAEEVALPEAREELDAEMDGRGSVSIMCVEGFASHRDTLKISGDAVDPRIRERIEIGDSLSAADYAQALLNQRRLRRSVVKRMADFDAVLAPTTLYTAPRIADVAKAPARLTTRLVNYLGLCAVSVPCGFSSDGLPVGLQVIGKPFDEKTILALSHLYQRVTTWHEQRPIIDSDTYG